MAKPQVTEADLAQSIQSLGGFGNLAARPKRDSPFGSDTVAKRAEPSAAPIVPKPSSTPVVSSSSLAAPSSQQPLAQKVEVTPRVTDPSTQRPAAITPVKSSPTKEIKSVVDTVSESSQLPDEFTERITLQMTAEMRDELTDIARTLQRAKRGKGERLTPNTLMRVAIRNFIDTFDAKNLGGVSTEEELLKEVQKKRR